MVERFKLGMEMIKKVAWIGLDDDAEDAEYCSD